MEIKQVSNEASETVWRIFDVRVVSEGEDKLLIQAGNGSTVWVYPREKELLYSCQTFKSLQDHAIAFARMELQQSHRLRSGLWGSLLRWFFFLKGNREPRSKRIQLLKRRLSEFASVGFLVTRDDLTDLLWKRLNSNAQTPRPSALPARISVLGIPTCERPVTLHRCLESFIGNLNLHGRSPDILIIDDSQKKKARRENRSLLDELSRCYGGRVLYMNRTGREAFAEAIALQADLDPEVTRFALMGHPSCIRSEGGARNAFLLLTQGTFALQTDDDTLCRPARLPTTRGETILTSRLSEDEYWYFQTYQDVVQAITMTDVDFIGLHEELLGKPLPELVAQYNDLQIDHVNVSFFEGLDNREGRIRMTLPGPAGDSCLYTDLYRIFLEGESLERLLIPERDYPWKLATRQVIRGVSSPVISDVTRCIGMNFAVDNRSLLPPFMPVQARCDGIFGDLMAVCFPQAYSGNIPWVIPHEPPGKRERTTEDLFEMLKGIRVNDIVSTLIFYWMDRIDRMDSKSAAENLLSVAEMFTWFAELPPKTFEEQVKNIYWSLTMYRIRSAEQRLLRGDDLPDYWKMDVERYISSVKCSVEQADFRRPVDIDHPGGSRDDFRQILHRFGKILMHWSQICEAVKTMDPERIETFVSEVEGV